MAAACLLLLTVSGPVARADSDPALTAAKKAFTKGQQHYLKKEYLKAAEAFLEAYKAKPIPAFLFNAAVAFEKGKSYVKAVKHFKLYLKKSPKAGDAAEFEGQVYGIIPPAIEQARIAAANMVTPGSRAYAGTLPATTLKVAGAELTSLGECIVDTDEYVQLRHTDLSVGHYRKFVLRDGRLVGAILLNDEERVRPVVQLIERGADVSAHTDRLLDDDFDLKSLLQAR